MLVLGAGDGTTGFTADANDFPAQVGKTSGDIVRGTISVFDPATGAAGDDWFVWFDEDADGNMDDTEIVLTRPADDESDVTDATNAGAFVRDDSNVLVGRLAPGAGLVLHDFDVGAGDAAVFFEATLGDRAVADPSTAELGVDIFSETDDLTGADDVYIGGGVLPNFLWSDKSSTSPSHTELSTDWTTGYLVPTLSSPTRVLVY